MVWPNLCRYALLQQREEKSAPLKYLLVVCFLCICMRTVCWQLGEVRICFVPELLFSFAISLYAKPVIPPLFLVDTALQLTN